MLKCAALLTATCLVEGFAFTPSPTVSLPILAHSSKPFRADKARRLGNLGLLSTKKTAFESDYASSIDNPSDYWFNLAKEKLDWYTQPTKSLTGGLATADVKWFEGEGGGVVLFDTLGVCFCVSISVLLSIFLAASLSIYMYIPSLRFNLKPPPPQMVSSTLATIASIATSRTGGATRQPLSLRVTSLLM